MQEKSSVKFSVPDRLLALRLHIQCTWKELAAKLDITDSMIYQVNKGKKNLSLKALHRLHQLELNEGLISAVPCSPGDSALEHSSGEPLVVREGNHQDSVGDGARLARLEDRLSGIEQLLIKVLNRLEERELQ